MAFLFFFFFFKRRVFIKAFSFMTSNPKKHWDSKQSCTQPNNCNSLPLLPLLSGGTVILNRFLYNPYVHLLLSLALLLWTWERERERERGVQAQRAVKQSHRVPHCDLPGRPIFLPPVPNTLPTIHLLPIAAS